MNTINKTIQVKKTDINTTKQLRSGQSIEEVMRIATANKEQLVATWPEMYQARNEGVDPLCDVRTDKFDLALDAMDKITRAHTLASANKDKMGKSDNTWITDEDGNPMFDNPHETSE